MAESQLLAPWEYLGERPQIVEAGELLYQGRMARYELLLKHGRVQDYYDFRVSHFGDDGSWDVVMYGKPWEPPEIPGSRLRKAVKKKTVRREFYIGSDLLRIRPNGTGYWYQDHEVMSSFHLGRSIVEFTSSQTYELILGLLAKPSSDVAYALRFKRMSYEEKKNRVFDVATSDELARLQGELSALCHLVLYSDEAIWHGKADLRWSLIASEARREAHFFSGWWPHNELESKRLNSWAKVLERFGPVHPKIKRLCVREEFRTSSCLIWDKLPAPSAHEQLEARLELEEWGHQNLPAAMWPELGIGAGVG